MVLLPYGKVSAFHMASTTENAGLGKERYCSCCGIICP